MAKMKKHTDDDSREISEFFRELPDNERMEMLGIWNKSGMLHREATANEITDEETEDALSALHNKLNFDSQQNEEPTTSAGSSSKIAGRLTYFLAAAAVALIAFGAWLYTPVTITVPAGQTLAMELRDGSMLTANSGTTFEYSRLFGITNRNISIDGEAFFEVRSSDVPFIANANGSVTEVLGTSFNIRSWSTDPDRETRLNVASGRVKFYPQSFPESAVELTEGHSSRISDVIKKPADPVRAPLSYAIAWRDNNLAFSVQPLSVIFDELERKYDVTIEWSEPEIAQTTLSTFYTQPDNVESVLADICTVKGLTFSQTSTGYRISRK